MLRRLRENPKQLKKYLAIVLEQPGARMTKRAPLKSFGPFVRCIPNYPVFPEFYEHLRFRTPEIVLIGDLEKAFRQMVSNEADRNASRFL